MKRYGFLDTEGNPVYSATPAIEDAYVDGQMYGEHLCKELPLDAFDDMTVLTTYYYKDGWKTRSVRPAAFYSWDNNIEQWVPDLAAARIAKNSIIDTALVTANQSGFTFGNSRIASDPLSRSHIDAVNGYVSIFNKLPPGWTGKWKTEAGTYLSVPNPVAWKPIYGAMVTQIQANFVKAERLKTAIAAATTIEDIQGINW
jgi:hypothetical protein